MGLELKLFEDNVSEDFLCRICKKVFLNPVSTPCLHLFCGNCLYRRIQNQKILNCPICKVKINEKGLKQPSTEFKLNLLELRIKCSNKCGISLPLGDLPDHVSDDCPYTPVTCPYKAKGCKKSVRRCDVKRHVEECDFREVVCEACGHTTVFCDLFTHQSRTRCLEKKLKQQVIRELRTANAEVRRHKSQLSRQHIRREIQTRQRELDHARSLQNGKLTAMKRYASDEMLSRGTSTCIGIFLTEDDDCMREGSLKTKESELLCLSDTTPSHSRADDNVYECQRCKKPFKLEVNHIGACRWHRGPIIPVFGGTCFSCGRVDYTRGCIAGYHYA